MGARRVVENPRESAARDGGLKEPGFFLTMSKKKKIRATFRKNRGPRARDRPSTQQFADPAADEDESPRTERLSGKGELTRKRTVIGEVADDGDSGMAVQPDVDMSVCLRGRVLRVSGLVSTVEAEGGRTYACAVRRLLKTLSTDQRHVVAAGDHVWFRPDGEEGIIERVEPRQGVISRTSRGRQHILVTNVDQILIVASAAEPDLKPHLIDRFLVTAEKSRLRPVICINKIDLVDPATLQPLIGVFSQMGYKLLTVSAATGANVPVLRELLRDCETVVAGQSGVGKSSLLNAVQPDLRLRTAEVSLDTDKGRHTTSMATLIPLDIGGYVVDTPGIRQFQLWDVIPEEIAGFFRDVRPFVSLCQFPDCTHTHESRCAVKDAVADGLLDARRYDSYCHMVAGDAA